jgi:SPP1 family predicted phage head-tail adaptor
MDSSRLKRRVVIQYPSTTQDAYGQPVVGFVTLATVWAAVEQLSGRQLFAAKQAQSEISVKVTIRYRTDVTTAMSVVYLTHTYQIDAVIDFEARHESLELLCTELAA